MPKKQKPKPVRKPRQASPMAKKLETEGWLPTSKAAELAGVPMATLVSWCRANKVQSQIVVGRRFVLKASVLTLLKPVRM